MPLNIAAPEPLSSRYPLTHVNPLVSCGPCQPQFSRNALLFERRFKVPIFLDCVVNTDQSVTLSSGKGELGRANYGTDQVVSGFTNVIASLFFTNLYDDGRFADNDCFFRAYGWSMKIDPIIYTIDDSSGPTSGTISIPFGNWTNTAVGSSMIRELVLLYSEAVSMKLIQRNSACEFNMDRVVDAAWPGTMAGEFAYMTGLGNMYGQESASAICMPGNTASRIPVPVISQDQPVSVTSGTSPAIVCPDRDNPALKLCLLVDVKFNGEDVYGEPVPLPV